MSTGRVEKFSMTSPVVRLQVQPAACRSFRIEMVKYGKNSPAAVTERGGSRPQQGDPEYDLKLGVETAAGHRATNRSEENRIAGWS